MRAKHLGAGLERLRVGDPSTLRNSPKENGGGRDYRCEGLSGAGSASAGIAVVGGARGAAPCGIAPLGTSPRETNPHEAKPRGQVLGRGSKPAADDAPEVEQRDSDVTIVLE